MNEKLENKKVDSEDLGTAVVEMENAENEEDLFEERQLQDFYSIGAIEHINYGSRYGKDIKNIFLKYELSQLHELKHITVELLTQIYNRLPRWNKMLEKLGIEKLGNETYEKLQNILSEKYFAVTTNELLIHIDKLITIITFQIIEEKSTIYTFDDGYCYIAESLRDIIEDIELITENIENNAHYFNFDWTDYVLNFYNLYIYFHNIVDYGYYLGI